MKTEDEVFQDENNRGAEPDHENGELPPTPSKERADPLDKCTGESEEKNRESEGELGRSDPVGNSLYRIHGQMISGVPEKAGEKGKKQHHRKRDCDGNGVKSRVDKEKSRAVRPVKDRDELLENEGDGDQ
jgi:hypothetical protein